MSWYTSLISSHPGVILVAVAVFSTSCIIISLTTIKLPNFSDPQLGFEARGTEIADRLTAWQNLQEAIKPSGPLTPNPLGDQPTSSHHLVFHTKNNFSKIIGEFSNKTISSNESFPETEGILTAENDMESYWPSNTRDNFTMTEEEFSNNLIRPNISLPETEKVLFAERVNLDSFLPGSVSLKNFTMTEEDFSNNFINANISLLETDKVLFAERNNMDSFLPSNTTLFAEEVLRNQSRTSTRKTWHDLMNLENIQRLDDEDEESDRFDEHFHDGHNHLSEDGFFCSSGPGPEFSRVVISSKDGHDLMSKGALDETCRLQAYLTNSHLYRELCENVRRGQCCQPWSLPNYVAMLNNRSSCFAITEEDVRRTRELIEYCSHFYYDLLLMPDLVNNKVPLSCKRNNAVYNLMHYILDASFMPPNVNETGLLKNTMVFLPMARSSAILKYYQALKSNNLKNCHIYISAMEFGLKNVLFDELLVKDTWLIALGALFVLCCMWFYTGSLFITLMTIIAIGFSLGIAYFIYTLVFEMHFFPFMNLLASIVAVGIGADDAFILSKMWQLTKSENCNLTTERLVQKTIKHSALSMFVTTVTTAAAFFSSYVSAITAIRCFSVFAGTAVIVNYLLMVTWLPACIVVSERVCWAPLPSFTSLLHIPQHLSSSLSKRFLSSVIQLKHIWLLSFSLAALACVHVVFYWPRLRLPDSPDFQLFSSSHPFERYDYYIKENFWFEKPQKGDASENAMPLRFVWGIVPEDNGDHLDPASRGTLKFDPRFDMAAPESQVWLVKFCHNLK